MEFISVEAIAEILTLTDVIVVNSRSWAVLVTKINELGGRVDKHNEVLRTRTRSSATYRL